ncbi:MAG: hypothetical protein EA377_03645 [Phycisphaerales bacterium]|nr:MAG: hypothetical protein EA377_03645 [Phycisphaerales bacterium]
MSTTQSSSVDRKLWFLLALTVVIGLGLRMTSPSDLDEKTQHKTIAYTVDIVENERWFLPRSESGEPATKPLLFNWLAVPAVKAFGYDGEWVIKLPSLVSGLATIGLSIWFAYWIVTVRGRDSDDLQTHDGSSSAIAFGVVAGILLFAGYPMFKQVYIARPEMINAFTIVASWALATLLLHHLANGTGRRKRLVIAAGFWITIGLAALAKGPPALLGIIYLVLASKLIYARWSLLVSTGWSWGLPLALAIAAIWFVPAYQLDPEHFRNTLIGEEVVDRVSEGGPLAVLLDLWKMPAYFVSRYLPWSIFAVMALLMITPRQWFRHPLGPAVLWLFVVVLFFSLSSGKIPRYLTPVYPAGAMLATYALISHRGLRWPAARVAAFGLITTIVLGVIWWTATTAAQNRFGEHNHAFARAVQEKVGAEPILFVEPRSEIIATLLGRHQQGMISDPPANEIRWVIANDDAEIDGELVIRSETLSPHGSGRIALYRRQMETERRD